MKQKVVVEPNLELAAEIWAMIRSRTESPSDGIAVLCLVIYRFWKDCNSVKPYSLTEFMSDTSETVKQFDMIQDIQGNA